VHPLAVWPAAVDLQGLVDLAYAVQVRLDGPSVLPDGRAGLVWLSDGTLRMCGPETRVWRPDRVGVTAVGVRLARGAVPAVLGVSATALLDRRMHLSELWGAAALDLAERLSSLSSPRRQAALLQDAIRTRRGAARPVDPVAAHVARRLAGEQVPVVALAREVGMSERQLHRRCLTALGYPPSRLARLLRLHRFLVLARTSPVHVTLAQLAAAAGYADQAHLSRDSRALTGRAPSAFRSAGPVSDPCKPSMAKRP